ncbi:MAG: TonB-dependent receptor [Rhizobacter sp.]|nr:TonB-dependent receptor [Chlorobiales bacterium]
MVRIVSLAFLLFIFASSTLSAQGSGGRLRGTVTEVQIFTEERTVLDSVTGGTKPEMLRIRKLAPLAGVRVSLKGTATGTLTDSAGRYFISRIPRGIYDVLYTAEGYKSDLFSGVSVKPDTITEIDMILRENFSAAKEIIVTANRYEQKLLDVSSSLSLLDPAFITERNTTSIDEALRFVSGVSFAGSNMSVRSSSGIGYGAGSRVQVMLDQIPLLAADNGEAKWDMFPVDFLERVEIIKGASSSLYGASAIGGAVNVITRNTFDTKTSVLIYGGLYGDPPYPEWKWSGNVRSLSGVEVSHAQQFGSLGTYLSVSRRNTDGYKENGDSKRWRLFTKLNYQLTPQSSLSLLGTYADDVRGNAMYWQSIDRALNENPSSCGVRLYGDKLFLAPVYTLRASRYFSFIVRSRYYRARFSDTNPAPQSSVAEQTGLEAQGVVELTRDISATVGLDGGYSSVNSNIFGVHTAAQFGGYLQIETPIFTFAKTTYGIRYEGVKADGEAFGTQLSPRVAINVPIGAYSAIRANLGRAFRSASVAERFTSASNGSLRTEPNPDLKPESSVSYEVGYKYSYSKPVSVLPNFYINNLSIDAAVFISDYKDLIDMRLNSAGDAFRFVNVTDARIAGFETAVMAEFNRRLFVVSISYTHTEPRDQTLNTALPYRNRNLFYATLQANYGIFSAEWNYRYLLGYDAINAELARFIADSEKSADVHVSDVRLGIKLPKVLGDELEASLLVRNLFNYTYVEQPASLAPIRHFMLQVRTAF